MKRPQIIACVLGSYSNNNHITTVLIVRTTCQNLSAAPLLVISSTVLSPWWPVRLLQPQRPHALPSPPPIHKDIAGPGSGASSLSLAALTSASTLGTGSIIHCAGTTVHLCPSWISPTTRRQEKMSLLPRWCQVMDFMFAGGVQVKTWGSHSRWPSQLRHLCWPCVQTYRLPWGSIKGGRGALVSMSDVFVCCGLLLCTL